MPDLHDEHFASSEFLRKFRRNQTPSTERGFSEQSNRNHKSNNVPKKPAKYSMNHFTAARVSTLINCSSDLSLSNTREARNEIPYLYKKMKKARTATLVTSHRLFIFKHLCFPLSLALISFNYSKLLSSLCGPLWRRSIFVRAPSSIAMPRFLPFTGARFDVATSMSLPEVTALMFFIYSNLLLLIFLLLWPVSY